MKRMRVLLLAAIVFAVGSAFATQVSFAPCTGETLYGKIIPGGADNNDANFEVVPVDPSLWTCTPTEFSFRCVYKKLPNGTYVPCDEFPGNNVYERIDP